MSALTPKKILILTPLKFELQALEQGLVKLGLKKTALNLTKLMPVYHFEKTPFYLAFSGHGKTQFGIQTQYLIDHIKDISAVLCVGSAGALSPNLAPGDVVIGEKTIEHDFYLKFVARELPAFNADPDLLANFRNCQPNQFKIHFGAIASGDEDIVDRKRAREIFEKTQALAVAWEGAGAARAARFNEIAFAEIRVITDLADQSSLTTFKKNLEQGFANLAQFLVSAFNISLS